MKTEIRQNDNDFVNTEFASIPNMAEQIEEPSKIASFAMQPDNEGQVATNRVPLSSSPSISVIVPVYNEINTIAEVLKRLESVCWDGACEWIVVDDGSNDGTTQVVNNYKNPHCKVLTKARNGGKTAAVRSALEIASGDWIVVQDADLEYDPSIIPKLLRLTSCSNKFDMAVYGRRPVNWSRPDRWFFALGVLVVDVAFLLLYHRWVRDHATCYKLVRRNWLLSVNLESNGFEGCVEITAKLMRSGIAIKQFPITYAPRRASEGKKLTASYGWTAICAVWRYRKWNPDA